MMEQVVYHLKPHFLGLHCVLTPRIPVDRALFENATVRRICVAPTIIGCLRAVTTTFYNRGIWHVYTTIAETHEPIRVPDVHLTGELWLLQKTEFQYAGFVCIDVHGTFQYHRFPPESGGIKVIDGNIFEGIRESVLYKF